MIFMLAANEPALMVFMTEKDLQNIRGGRTVFVDQRQIRGHSFKKVVIAYAKTDQAALDMIQKHAGTAIDPASIVSPEPTAKEGRCSGCNGCIAEALLFEGKCNICWAEEAKSLRRQSN